MLDLFREVLRLLSPRFMEDPRSDLLGLLPCVLPRIPIDDVLLLDRGRLVDSLVDVLLVERSRFDDDPLSRLERVRDLDDRCNDLDE